MGQERPRPAPPRQGVRRAPRGEQSPVDPRDGPAPDPERPRRLPRIETLLRFDEAGGRGGGPLVPDLPPRRQRRARRLHVLLLAPAGHLPGRSRRRVSEDRGPALGHRREGAPHLGALGAEGGPGDPKPLHHPGLRPLSLGCGRRAAPRDPRRPSPRGRETGRDGRHDGPQGIHRDGRADSAGERRRAPEPPPRRDVGDRAQARRDDRRVHRRRPPGPLRGASRRGGRRPARARVRGGDAAGDGGGERPRPRALPAGDGNGNRHPHRRGRRRQHRVGAAGEVRRRRSRHQPRLAHPGIHARRADPRLGGDPSRRRAGVSVGARFSVQAKGFRDPVSIVEVLGVGEARPRPRVRHADAPRVARGNRDRAPRRRGAGAAPRRSASFGRSAVGKRPWRRRRRWHREKRSS